MAGRIQLYFHFPLGHGFGAHGDFQSGRAFERHPSLGLHAVAGDDQETWHQSFRGFRKNFDLEGQGKGRQAFLNGFQALRNIQQRMLAKKRVAARGPVSAGSPTPGQESDSLYLAKE